MTFLSTLLRKLFTFDDFFFRVQNHVSRLAVFMVAKHETSLQALHLKEIRNCQYAGFALIVLLVVRDSESV